MDHLLASHHPMMMNGSSNATTTRMPVPQQKAQTNQKKNKKATSSVVPPKAEKVYQFKLVLLGDTGVGKSSLALRYIRGFYQDNLQATIGAAFLAKSLEIEDTKLRFEIWDTAGQERYHSLAPMYYRGAKAAAIVFDLTRAETFINARQWIRELQREGAANVTIVLVGNKADLTSKREVSFEDASTYASHEGLLYLETSAKAFQNVDELFVGIAKNTLPQILREAEERALVEGGRNRNELSRSSNNFGHDQQAIHVGKAGTSGNGTTCCL